MIALVAGLGLTAVAQGTIGNLSTRFSDSFGQRGVINLFATPSLATVVGSLSNATYEVGEPYIENVSSGQTVWAQWTAPSNGIVSLDIQAETFSPLVTVYAGSAPSAENPLGAFPNSANIPSVFTNLSLVASNNYLVCYEDEVCGCHWRERSSITFHVVRGQDYQICVDSAIITDAAMQEQSTPIGRGLVSIQWVPVFTTMVPPGGDFILDLNFNTAPANDDFANRHKLAGTQIATTASNAGASKEPGEPEHLGNPGGSSIWYTWTAPASGRVTITTNQVPQYAPPSSTDGGGEGVIITQVNPTPPTCGNEIDQNPPPVFYPIFAAYTGTAVDALTPADNLPIQLAAFPNGVEFDVLKGTTYQIAFDGNEGTTGEIPLHLELTTPPPNADPRHPIELHGVSVSATGYNAGAALPPGGFGFPTPPGIIPPVPISPIGPVPFTNVIPGFPTNIIVYPTNFISFPTNTSPVIHTNVGPFLNTNVIPITPIILVPWSPLPTNYVIVPWSSPPGPLALAVKADSAQLGYHPFKAAWWSWTAPVSGTVTIDLTGSDYPFPITVIAEPAVRKPAAYVETGLNKVSFEAIQGRTYLIEVAQTYAGQTGEIKLSLQAPIIDLPANPSTQMRGGDTLLSYVAAPGEIVALLRSIDGQNWKIVQTTTVDRFGNSAEFVVKSGYGSAPDFSNPAYRAIIFDRVDAYGF